MNASNRRATRVDRAAVGATFAAAVLTLCISNVAMQPVVTPLIAPAQVVRLAADTRAAGEPCAHAALTAGEPQTPATGRN
jgi:hypothetical protein